MTPDELSALRKELQTQDNACTAHPLYCVYDHHLRGRRKSVAPKDNWRFITACLTKQAAERYIAKHSHRLHKPFVYVDTMYGNDEMIALRNHLMSGGSTP